MKKSLYILVFLLISCGGSSDDSGEIPSEPEEVNNAPTVPKLVYPSNNLLCIENKIDFLWDESVDPDGDAINYIVEISSDVNFDDIVYTKTSTGVELNYTLEKGQPYYWRVKAVDNVGGESDYTSANSFYTEGEAVSNYLPFSPELVSPQDEGELTVGEITLKWNAEDLDNDDLVFDILFNAGYSALEVIATDITATEYTVNVNSGNTYFWKVVVKDGKSGYSVGQTWSFKVN